MSVIDSRPALRRKIDTAESAGELEQVSTDVGSSVGFVTADLEITHWFVAGALGLLALTAIRSLAFFSRLP